MCGFKSSVPILCVVNPDDDFLCRTERVGFRQSHLSIFAFVACGFGVTAVLMS